MTGKLLQWLRGHVPTREAMGANRYVRPFAHLVLRAELWRFTRRSVPRGVALGLFIGVAIPFAHSPIAAILAFFVGANVPIAFATTWAIGNPLTWPVMWPLAYQIGRLILPMGAFAQDRVLTRDIAGAIGAPSAGGGGGAGVHHFHMLHHLLAFICGLAVEGVVLAVVGYGAASIVWRLRVMRKWRGRLRHGRGAA